MAKYKGKVNARKVADQFAREAARLRVDLEKAMRDVGDDAELIYASLAPVGQSGRLSRGITAFVIGDQVWVRAEAKNPQTGYDYVGVTRFGHKLRKIFPTRVWAHNGPGKINVKFPWGWRRIDRAPALKTPFGFRRWVRGYKPKRDWAEPGLRLVTDSAQKRLDQLGHGFTARIG